MNIYKRFKKKNTRGFCSLIGKTKSFCLVASKYKDVKRHRFWLTSPINIYK